MATIIISEFMDEAAVGRLAAVHETTYDPALVDQPDRLRGLVAQADCLIVRNRTQVRGDLLATGQKLACVGRLGVGLDNIDVPACENRGIAVYPATGANDLAVAEYVISTAMMLLRGAYHATADVMAGGWPRTRLMGRETAGTTLGLIGYGAIGRLTAAKAHALGMTVIAHDPFIDPAADLGVTRLVSFAELLANADVISLHVPLTKQTAGLIDAAAMRAMKPGAILVNAARGGVVDEGALVDALRSGHLGGAALDVFDTEPLDSVQGAVFSGLSNVILTPHIAGVTQESNVRVSHLIADRVLDHLKDC